MIKHFRSTFASALLAIILVTLWELSARNNFGVEFFASSPSLIAKTLAADILRADLLQDLLITFFCALGGLALGSAIALAVAVVFAAWPALYVVFRPFLLVVAAIPVIALAPLMILGFGTGMPLEFAISTISVFLIVLAQAHEGLSHARSRWEELALDDGVTHSRFFWFVALPGAAVWVFAGMRTAISFALLGAFIGEFISSERGIGRYVLRNAALYDASRVMAGVTLIGIAAFLVTSGIDLIQRRLIPIVVPSLEE